MREICSATIAGFCNTGGRSSMVLDNSREKIGRYNDRSGKLSDEKTYSRGKVESFQPTRAPFPTHKLAVTSCAVVAKLWKEEIASRNGPQSREHNSCREREGQTPREEIHIKSKVEKNMPHAPMSATSMVYAFADWHSLSVFDNFAALVDRLAGKGGNRNVARYLCTLPRSGCQDALLTTEYGHITVVDP